MVDMGIGKNQIEEALEVAAEAHQGQFRKGTCTPYITHPYAVGLILMEVGCPEPVVVAGILHDTVEDTDITLACLRERFGDHVARIVDGCSENKALRWRDRKTERIESLRTASAEVCSVTCADKLHNLRTIISAYAVSGDAVWDRFHGDVVDQAWYYRSILAVLSERAAALQKGEGRAKLSQVAGGEGSGARQRVGMERVPGSLFQRLERAVTCLFDG